MKAVNIFGSKSFKTKIRVAGVDKAAFIAVSYGLTSSLVVITLYSMFRIYAVLQL